MSDVLFHFLWTSPSVTLQHQEPTFPFCLLSLWEVHIHPDAKSPNHHPALRPGLCSADEKAVGEIESVWSFEWEGGECVDEKGGQDLAFHLCCPEIEMLPGKFQILMRIEMMNPDLINCTLYVQCTLKSNFNPPILISWRKTKIESKYWSSPQWSSLMNHQWWCIIILA